MKILALAWSFLRGGSRPVQAASFIRDPSLTVEDFSEDYLVDRAESILQFFLYNTNSRLDTSYHGSYFGEGKNSATYTAFVNEELTLLKEKGRNFIVSTLGVYDPRNYSPSFTDISSFPSLEKEINGFITRIEEVTDVKQLSKTGKAVIYSKAKSTDGLPDYDGVKELHDEVVQKIISAADLKLGIDEVCDWLLNERLESEVKRLVDL